MLRSVASIRRAADLARAIHAAACAQGTAITSVGGKLNVPNDPIIPFIEGDGTGRDIWRASRKVIDSAVTKAYNGKRKIEWLEVLAGEKAFRQTGNWMPDATMDAFRKYLIGIKGPLTTPVGGGMRSLNVALRQELDLYVCLRPVRYFKGTPSPVKAPHLVDMVIFRENTEDIYAGIEFKAGTPEAAKVLDFLTTQMKVKSIRFPASSAFGIKPISKEGSERLIRASIQYALDNKRKSVTIVHKGNIMKFTEGGFRDWGYGLARTEFRSKCVTQRESWILANFEKDAKMTAAQNAKAIEPGFDLMTKEAQEKLVKEVQTVEALKATHGNGKWKQMVMVKDAIADIALQQVLTRAEDFDVIATMNLNGDYLSDALAAQVGGIGIAPGANINAVTHSGIFEATHGTAPKYADLDQVNPGSMILSAEMMLRHLNWKEAADLIIKGMDGAIAAKTVTYDFARLMGEGSKLLKCSEFGDAVVKNM